MDASRACRGHIQLLLLIFFCPQLYNRSSVLGSSLNRLVWRASVSHKSGKAFRLIWNRICIDCSPSGEICVTTEWECCTKVLVCVFCAPHPPTQCVPGGWAKDKKALTQNFWVYSSAGHNSSSPKSVLKGFWISSPSAQWALLIGRAQIFQPSDPLATLVEMHP